MRRALGLLAAIFLAGQAALASDVFVRDTHGTNLSTQDTQAVTDAVKRAVSNMDEHTLVDSEDQADFVLQPSVVNRGGEMVLRIEKLSDGQTLAISEEPISTQSSRDPAVAVTEQALRSGDTIDSFASDMSGPAMGDMPDDTVSGTTSPDDIASEETMPADDPFATDLTEEEMAEDTFAADDTMPLDETVSGTTEPDTMMEPDTTTDAMASDMPPASGQAYGGEVRGPSPLIRDDRGRGYFTVGLGPAFSLGLESDNVMYNIIGAYNMDFSPRLTGKVFGDFNLGSGDDSSQLINVGIGAEYFPTDTTFAFNGSPYLMADLGYAFARDVDDRTADSPAVGAGAGFKFQAQQLNWDVNLHYTFLTGEIEGDNPSILGLRAALNF